MGRASQVLPLLACVAVVTTFVAYTLLLQQQSSGPGGAPQSFVSSLQGAPTWFLAVLAAAAAANGAAIWLPAGRPRRVLLMAVTALLVGVGVLAIFSVGLALLIAAVLTGLAAAHDGSAGGAGRAVGR